MGTQYQKEDMLPFPGTRDDATRELRTHTGPPWCQDCKWSLNSPITKGCGCVQRDTKDTPEARKAYARARFLQDYIRDYPSTFVPSYWGLSEKEVGWVPA